MGSQPGQKFRGTNLLTKGLVALGLCLAASLPAQATTVSAPLAGGGSYYAPGTPISSNFVLGPTTPGKWGPPAFGTGATVTWSLMATGISCAGEFAGCTITALADFMPAGFHAAIVAAFSAWSAVANITFMEVPDSGLPYNAAGATGDIRIGGHVFDGASGTLAHGFFPPANGDTAAGDIHFDIAETWKLGFGGPGFDIFQVMAHEIGHAIGLNHTAVPASLMNPFYTEAFSGPQADDIAGAVFIYGSPVAPVPEPGTWLLFISGLALLAFSYHRRARRATRVI